MKKKHQLPMYLAFFLLLLWGAYKKAERQAHHQLFYDKATSIEQLQEKIEATKGNWLAFYKVCRPALPAMISDEEIKYMFHYYSRPSDQADDTMSKRDRLESLLIVFSYKLQDKYGD